MSNDTWIQLHARGRPIVQCTMWNKRTPDGYTHPSYKGYFTGYESDGAVLVVAVPAKGLLRFSAVDGMQIGSITRGNGWKINLQDLDQPLGNESE